MTRLYRPPTVYAPPDNAPDLTAEQTALIDSRTERLLRFVHDQLRDPGFAAVGGTGLWATVNIQRARLLMLGKAALIDGGRALLDHWTLIEPELYIGWRLHAWHIDETQWNNRLASMGRQLHTTDTTKAMWEPVTQTAPPALTDVAELDVLQRCGIIGGVHSGDDHHG